MNESNVLLDRYLRERDDRRAALLFSALFQSLQGLLYQVLSRERVSREEREDRVLDVQVRLWRALERRRLNDMAGAAGVGGAITNLRAYVISVTKSVSVDRGARIDSPAYAGLLRKVRHLAGPAQERSPFALWDYAGRRLCGFREWSMDDARIAAWRNGCLPALNEETLDRLRSFIEQYDPEARSATDLPLLMQLVLAWLDAPVPLGELVDWIAATLGIIPVRFTTEADLVRDNESDAPVEPVTRITPEREVVGLITLRAAFSKLPPRSQWVIIGSLSHLEIEALMTRDDISGLLMEMLKPAVPPGELGGAIQGVWARLPLPDAELARIAGVEVGTLHVIRNRARKLLAKYLEDSSEDV